MIYGVGIDTLEIHRMKKHIQDHAFLERVFNPREIEMGKKRNFAPAFFAGLFCAKEAFFKACAGIGQETIVISDVAIDMSDEGNPVFVIDKKLEGIMRGKRARLSLSHTEDHAMAMVIIESDDSAPTG